MKFLGRQIELSEFIPPIFLRGYRKIFSPKNRRFHPFDCIPLDLKVQWIMDVGANIGEVAFAGLKSFPNSKIICFEPVKNTFAELERKLSPFSGRVFLNNFALGEKKEELEINITSFHGANSICRQSELHKQLNPHVRERAAEKIVVMKLDDISPQLPTSKIDVLKIDVEGYEKNVLLGGENFIRKNVVTIVIEISLMRDQSNSKQCVFEIFTIMDSFGFKLTSCFDPHFSSNNELVQMDCCFRSDHLT